MKPGLPHFGSMVDIVRRCLDFAPADAAVLSERTRRTLASGEPIKEKSWDEYASEFIDALLAGSMFPLDEADRKKLIRDFHAYRSSYEQLSEMMTRLQFSPAIRHRGVIRLQVLDLGFRYFALCSLNDSPPTEGDPLWAKKDGANRFWKRALEQAFPGVPVVGSKKVGGDCASRLDMNHSKMRRCLYENDVPSLDALTKVFADTGARRRALRHYAAFRLCQKLADDFGQVEVEFWAKKLILLARWLTRFFKPIMDAVDEKQRLHVLKRMFIGGIGDSATQRLISEKLGNQLPPAFRSDLLAIAEGNPMAAISRYGEFCEYMGGRPPEGTSWEEAFDCFQVEYDEFQATGNFPDGNGPSAKLRLARLLSGARCQKDAVLSERILRRIISIDPTDEGAHQLLAQICEKQGQLEEAWREFEIAAACKCGFSLPLFSLADSKSRAGCHEDALAIAQRIPSEGLGPGSRSFIIGVCLMRAGKYPEAVKPLEDAYHNDWEPAAAAALLSEAHARMKINENESEKAARKWKKLAFHHGLRVEQVLEAIDFESRGSDTEDRVAGEGE